MRRPSLAELYRTHSPGALRLAYVLVGDDDTAQDVVHEAFLRLFGRYRDLRDPEHFDAYLRRTIINLSKKLLAAHGLMLLGAMKIFGPRRVLKVILGIVFLGVWVALGTLRAITYRRY